MTDDRYAQLKPPNLVTTLRSFPRRYREALAAVPPEPELLTKPVDGHTVLALVADTAQTLELLDRAVEQTLVHDAPSLGSTLLDASARRSSSGSTSTSSVLLEELAAHAGALADRLDRAPTADWTRPATVGDRRVHAIDLVREAVRTGAENLRLLERVVAHLA